MSIVDEESEIFEAAYDKTVVDVVCLNNPKFLGQYDEFYKAIKSNRVRTATSGIFVVNQPVGKLKHYVWYNGKPIDFSSQDLGRYPGISSIIMSGIMADHLAQSINAEILETLMEISKY